MPSLGRDTQCINIPGLNFWRGDMTGKLQCRTVVQAIQPRSVLKQERAERVP